MKTRYLAILATLALLGFSVPAAAHPCKHHDDKSHEHCVSDPKPSGGHKALLFEIDGTESEICGGVTDPIVTAGDSFGQVSWAGNVLWDAENIHVHFKLQLEDVDPGVYPIFGNNDIDCTVGHGTDPFLVPLCADGVCDLEITVKQNRQGRTSGALRLPGCDANKTTAVWVTVTDDDVSPSKILRSTPVTVVLPPNEVGTDPVGEGPECSE